MIAGAVLSQELLVRFLENEGAIEKGEFRSFLQEHLSNVSPARRDQAMYGPIRALVKSLGKPAPKTPSKH
jgi:hypothetical protein